MPFQSDRQKKLLRRYALLINSLMPASTRMTIRDLARSLEQPEQTLYADMHNRWRWAEKDEYTRAMPQIREIVFQRTALAPRQEQTTALCTTPVITYN